MDYKDKVVMITGANRGIGLAIAQGFYENGATLSLGLKSPNEFNSPFEKSRCLLVKVDVRSDKDLQHYYDMTIERFGIIHILVNNAGIDKPCSLLNITRDYLTNMMNVNLFSMVLLSKLVASTMIENKTGWIINLSSIAGKEGTPLHVGYTASKHAVIGFTKSAAQELIKSNVIVNTICPGLIETDMLNSYFDEYAQLISGNRSDELNTMIKKIPRQKMGQPNDVANLILFLCSGRANNIIGQAINTDGGYLQW